MVIERFGKVRSKNNCRIEEGIWITKPDPKGGIGKPNLA